MLGIQSLRLSKEHRTPTSVAAVFGIVLGALSLFSMVGGGLLAWKADAKHEDKELSGPAAVGAPDAGTGAYLDASAACTLIEKELKRGLYEKKTQVEDVQCPGAFDVDERRASIHRVEATIGGEHKVFTACYAHSRRWFALSVTEGGAACPAATLPVPAPRVTKPSESELEKEEEGLRKSIEEQEQTVRVEAFTTSLRRLQSSVHDDSIATTCPEIDPADHGASAGHLTPSTVDVNYLMAAPAMREAQQEWSFLTSERIKIALDEKKPIKARSDAVRQIVATSGTYLVVFVGDTRDSSVKPTGARLTFEGTLVVADIKTYRPLCATGLSFTSGVAAPKPAKGAPIDELLPKAHRGLAAKFLENADAELKELTDEKLVLSAPALEK